MKIVILTYGSRGDVQPFVPLSLKLMETGHTVKLAAPFRFKHLVEEHGIDFVPLAGDPEDLSRRFNHVGHNFIKMIAELMEHAIEIGADILRQTEDAGQDADLIVHTFAHAAGGHMLAREKNIPDIHVETFPMFAPTGDYPNVTLPDLRVRSLNRLTHVFSEKIAWWTAWIGFERVRHRAGLQRRKLYWPFADDPVRPRTPILGAWSPRVLPVPADFSSHIHITGYYFFPQNESYQPSTELNSFLQKEKPPVCVTFGSMVNRNAERINDIVCEALERTENRGIILSGWSGIERSSSNDLLYLEAVPHEWLLPRCKLVVHHGGAGTTAAGLRAGIPTIVVPFTGDQPFWGRRVRAVGAGPEPILVRNLSVERLRRAIVEAETDAVRERAQAIGREIRNEDGIGESVKWIEKYSNEFHSRR